MLLTGAMSKMGVYGVLRILRADLPGAGAGVAGRRWWRWPWFTMVLFAAATAFAQRDLKRMLAYSSINHLGYCLLAVLAAAGHRPEATHPERTAAQAAALSGVRPADLQPRPDRGDAVRLRGGWIEAAQRRCAASGGLRRAAAPWRRCSAA
jgi:hypothetical protein